jgi:predicted esterase
MNQTQTIREQADNLLQQGKGAEAIALYEQWLRAVPTDAEAALNVAKAYAMTGRPADASLALQLALRQGLQRVSRISADSALVPVLRTSAELASQVRTRLAADSSTSTLYTRQQRIGTSMVTYPDDYRQGRSYRLVMLLHGNGHSSNIMTSWAKRLGLEDVIFVAPQAPYVKLYETIASARGRFSAAGEELNAPDSLLDDVVTTSVAWYHAAMMDAMRTLPVDKTRKPVVIGFSQGGFYAHVLATRHPGDIDAYCSISASMYAYGDVLSKYPQLRTFGVRALVMHGTKDVIVPLQTAELIRAALTKVGVDHAYHTFDGGHWPTADADKRLVDWLRSL